MRYLLYVPGTGALIAIVLTAGLLGAGLFYYLLTLDRQLAPYSIVAFEFAFTPAYARTLLGTWGEAGVEVARRSLWVDFLFMPAYAFFFAGLTLLAARAVRGRVGNLGLAMIFSPFVAWLFDAIENIALLSILEPGGFSTVTLVVAGFAASLKFALLALCLLYVAGAFALRLARGRV
jgi:hypothetical protein